MCQKTTRATFHMKFLQRGWWKAWKEPKRQRIEMQQAYRHVAHGILLCYSHMFLTITYFFLCLSRNDSLYFSWLVPFFPKKKFEGVRFIIIPWKFQVWLETSHMFVLLCGTIGFGSSFSISCTLFYIIYCYPVINTIQEVIHFLSFILLKIVGAFFHGVIIKLSAQEKLLYNSTTVNTWWRAGSQLKNSFNCKYIISCALPNKWDR